MKYTEVIIDAATGEQTVREFTPDEVAQIELKQKEINTKIAENDSKAAQREAIADKLGLTIDELKVLLG
jgi:hypothetical protein